MFESKVDFDVSDDSKDTILTLVNESTRHKEDTATDTFFDELLTMCRPECHRVEDLLRRVTSFRLVRRLLVHGKWREALRAPLAGGGTLLHPLMENPKVCYELIDAVVRELKVDVDALDNNGNAAVHIVAANNQGAYGALFTLAHFKANMFAKNRAGDTFFACGSSVEHLPGCSHRLHCRDSSVFCPKRRRADTQ